MIVNNSVTYQSMLDFINDSNYLAYDVESTGTNVRKDTVIGFGVSNSEDKGFYLPLFIWDDKKEVLEPTEFDPIPILLAIKESNLIMWNASFDIRITKNNLGVDLLDSLFAEGMLMKHCLNEDGGFKLKDTAIEYSIQIGFDAQTQANKEQLELKTNLKRKGAKASEFYKADLSILGKYCIQDCVLTFKLFAYFHEELEKEDLIDFFYEDEVMPLYKLVTIPMEENGVKLDMDLLNKSNDNILKDLQRYKELVTVELLKLPETQEVIDDMAKKKYPQKKGGAFGQKVVEVYGLVDLPKTKAGKYSLSSKALDSLDNLTEDQQKAVEFLRGDIIMNDERSLIISRMIYDEKNEVKLNINSRTQMSNIVFEKMNLKPLGYTEGGAPQFNADFIESIKDDFSWASELSIYFKLLKIQTSYFKRLLEGQEDGLYYFSYKQHGTISGRYGSDAQQMPRPKEVGELPDIVLKYNNIIRNLMITKSGKVFIDDDYESLEPHVFSHVTGDPDLIGIFNKGHDFYSTIVIRTEDLIQYSPDKLAENYLGKLNKPVRQAGKAYALGVPYGMEDYALGMALGIPTREAKVKRQNYLGAFKGLSNWMVNSDTFAKVNGYIKSESGRVRHLPNVKALYEQHGNRLNDWKYKKSLKKRLGEEEFTRVILDWKNGLNNAKNFQIQSLSASIMNRSCIALARKFKELDLDALIIAQIHDQIIVECDGYIKNEVKDLVEDCLENTYKLKLKLKAPAEFANNWNEGH